jgi:heptosyltransferase I
MRSVLLVKTSSLGDVIHNLPVVTDLRRHWPHLEIDWVVEESFADIPRLHPGVHEVIPVALRRWRQHLTERATWHEIRAFGSTLRRRHYDLVIDTQGLVKSALITRAAHGLRCGYAREVAREPLAALAYDRHYVIPRTAHAVERNRWLAAAAAGYIADTPLSYGVHAYAPRPEWQPALPYAVLLSATSRDDKLWDDAHWITLGQALATRGLVSVLPAGNARERKRAERLATHIPNACVPPPSRVDTLASVMAQAQCVVGVDTGLTHLAAALGRPVVAVFVATDPGLTGVYGGPQAVNLGTAGHAPSPQEVLERMQRWLP